MGAERWWTTGVVTLPGEVPREGERIAGLLQSGATDYVHIRKPGWDTAQIRCLLDEVGPEWHGRLILHDGVQLLDEGYRCGVQLNARNNRSVPVGISPARIGNGCHDPAETVKAFEEGAGYVTLSPVFDSISKPGYKGAVPVASVEICAGREILAMGGVTPADFGYLARYGFRGAVLCGYVWNGGEKEMKRLARTTRMMHCFRLQSVTDGTGVEETVRQAERVLEGGCRWVQVRMKEATRAERADAAVRVRDLCRAAGAVCLVDDDVEVARDLGIGVHLGKDDMGASQARGVLGEEAIIGRTANCAADVDSAMEQGGADYLGVGPFRFTQTKKKLAPVLGAGGIGALGMRHGRGALPVVAIGGITVRDVNGIMRLPGVQGVAVSGAVNHSADPVGQTKLFINEINNAI